MIKLSNLLSSEQKVATNSKEKQIVSKDLDHSRSENKTMLSGFKTLPDLLKWIKLSIAILPSLFHCDGEI